MQTMAKLLDISSWRSVTRPSGVTMATKDKATTAGARPLRVKTSALKVVDSQVLRAEGGGSRETGVPVQRKARAAPGSGCPLCGVGVGESEVRIGPVYMKVCRSCVSPLWHGMGLLNWFKRAGVRKR